jgi:hypothetical protein
MIAWGVQIETTTLEVGPGEQRIPSDDLLQPLGPGLYGLIALLIFLVASAYCDLEFDSFMNGQLPFPPISIHAYHNSCQNAATPRRHNIT